jgi:glycosyltransferase involved in cell wall biosynthesis
MSTLALVVNEPPPYRIPVFNRVAAHPGLRLQVIFCCRREPNREWDLPAMAFDHQFLRERITTVHGRYIHNNPDVLLALSRLKPDAVIGNGFNPTHLYAMAWCAVRGRPYLPMTDGTLQSEQGLGDMHRRLRRWTYGRAPAAIAASQGGLALYRSYGVQRSACFQSCLCVANERFRPPLPDALRPWDFLFCGRLEPGKRPAFALEVALQVARRLRRKIRLLFVGSGSLASTLQAKAEACANEVDTGFHGFASQAELPQLYRSAKLFLFPTEADVWGVVANEACAAGLPVIVSPHAGVAGELVIDGSNGFVRELDASLWAEAAVQLLSNERRRRGYAERSLLMVEPYHFGAAAAGIIDAFMAATASAGKSATLAATTKPPAISAAPHPTSDS